jgi:RNA polymerase sigma factor (sigma-70 family)
MNLTRDQQLVLLAQARDGSKEALAELLDDFRRPALKLVHQTLGAARMGPEHADEILAQAALRFQQTALRTFNGRAAPRTYFVRVAINCAIRLISAQPRAELSEDMLPVESPEEKLLALETDAERDRMLAALRQCVAELPPSYRRVVQLYYLEQHGTCEACARRLRISKSAFMQRLSRARRMLAAAVRGRLAREAA